MVNHTIINIKELGNQIPKPLSIFSAKVRCTRYPGDASVTFVRESFANKSVLKPKYP